MFFQELILAAQFKSVHVGSVQISTIVRDFLQWTDVPGYQASKL